MLVEFNYESEQRRPYTPSFARNLDAKAKNFRLGAKRREHTLKR